MIVDMQSEKYKIAQYLVYKINEEEAVVQSQTTTTVINNEKMIQMLFLFENKEFITDNQLLDYFGDHKNQAVKFLINEGLISSEPYRNFDIESIIFIGIDQLNKDIFPRTIEGIKVIHSNINSLENDIKENCIVISYFNPYHVKMVDAIQSIIEKSIYKETIYQLNIFTYGMSIYVDNLYNSNWVVPNHRDHLGIIRTEKQSDENNLSYVDLLNYIYDKDPLFNIERPLEDDEQIFVLNFILTRIHLLVSLKSSDMLREYEILKIFEINLNERRIYKDTASFWELSEENE